MEIKMMDVKYLSNKELVNEIFETCCPSRSPEEYERRHRLKEEILRRLKEPINKKIKKRGL